MLCLDVGNSHIYGGIFKDNLLCHQFRYPSNSRCTSDELGIFLINYFAQIPLAPTAIEKIVLCSVVPSLNYSIRAAFLKYFGQAPIILDPSKPNPLINRYWMPSQVGPDRLANAIAATHLYPDQPVIIVDLGSATTIEAVSANKEFLGGAILPGLSLQMLALNEKTANLPPVNIVSMPAIMGQSTETNIQSGLYYGHLGAIREIVNTIQQETFNNAATTVIGTGGFSHLFAKASVFTALEPTLVLEGLRVFAGFEQAKTPA